MVFTYRCYQLDGREEEVSVEDIEREPEASPDGSHDIGTWVCERRGKSRG